MAKLDELTLESFKSELEKLGWSPNYSALTKRMIGTAGSLGGVGAAAGGLLGAGVQGVRGYQQAKQEGATTGQALGAAAGKGLRGGLVGAGVGAVGGAAGGAALGRLAPGAAQKAVSAVQSFGPTKSLSNYGQRQAHWLTGWKPEAGLGSIGLGSTPIKGQLAAAESRLQGMRSGAPQSQGMLGRVLGEGNAGKLREWNASREVDRLKKHVGALDKAEEMGVTSIPGMVHSVRTHGLLPTVGAGLTEQWHSGGPAMKAMMFGLPAYQIGSGLMHRGEEGSGANIGSGIGQLASAALGPMPMTGQLLGSSLLMGGAERAGKRFDKRGRLPAPEEEPNASPVDRQESNAYRGLPPEGSVG